MGLLDDIVADLGGDSGDEESDRLKRPTLGPSSLPDLFDQGRGQTAPLASLPASRPAPEAPTAPAAPAPALATPEPPQPQQPGILQSIVDTVTTPSKLAPLALRTASAFTPGGPIGAAVGAAGEAGAEGIEYATGQRDAISPVEIAGQAGIGAIPFGRFAEGTSLLGRIVREAGRGAAAVSLDTLTREGRLPSAGEAAVGAGLGAVGGAASQFIHQGEQAAAPVLDAAGNAPRSLMDDALRVVAPERRTEGAEETAAALRQADSYRAVNAQQLENTFGQAAADFDRASQENLGLRNAVVDAYEGADGGTGGVEAVRRVAPEYAPVLERLTNLQQEAHDAISELRGGDLGFRDFYLSRNFRYVGPGNEEEAAQQLLQRARSLGTEPGFTRGRSLQFEAEARNMGFQQVEQNPIRQSMNYLASAKQYEQALVTFRDLEERGLITPVAPLQRGPEGMVPIQNRLVRTLDEEGNLTAKQYYASEPVARIFNNYLGQGLSGSPTFQALHRPATLINTFRVALSAFHVTLTAINSAAEGLGTALVDVATGHPVQGTIGAARSLTTVGKVWQDYMRSAAPLRSLPALEHFASNFDLESDIGRIVMAGGRVNDRQGPRAFFDAARGALADGRLLAAAGHAAEGLSAIASYPLMNNFVPRVKLGAFLGLAESEINRRQPATREETLHLLRALWDHTDDVFGQLVTDNLTFSKRMKDMLSLVIGFPGWNIGSARKIVAAGRGLGAAAVGAPVNLESQQALRYWLGLTAQVALMGSVLNYAWTGKWPTDIKDAFYPRTGNTLPNGEPERRQLPSYIKDVVGLATHPLSTIAHKQNPLLGTVAELADNIDFYGNQIRDPGAPIDQQALDVGKHVAKAFVPFSLSGLANSEGKTIGQKATNFVGINPPPASISNSKAQNLINDFTAERAPAQRSKQEYEAGQARRKIVQDLRQNNPEAEHEIEDALGSGLLNREKLKNLRGQARTDPLVYRFKKLDLDQAIQVYRVADEGERAKLRIPLLRKYQALEGPGRAEAHRSLVDLGIFDESPAASSSSFGFDAR